VSIGGEIEQEKVISAIENYLSVELLPNTYSVRVLGSALAGTFLSQARFAFIFAFIFMATVVFFYFRSPLASLSIIVAVACDVVVILGFMSLLNIRLSLATMAGLLMIIAYGVDSNVLLSSKLTQEREGEPFDRLRIALRTGITMSATTLSALTALFLIANSLVLKEIAGVLIIGLSADLVNTWILNSNILLWRLK
jgi:preprotein translocase subunit SecF